MKELRILLSIIVPRIVTEKVVLEKHDEEWIPLFCYEDLKLGETYYATGTVRGFNLFGFKLFPMLNLESIVIDDFKTPYAGN